MEESTRRALVKRFAAIAAAGYVAPKVVRIDTASATHTGGGGCLPPPGGSDGGSDD